jgi:energy-coupling factor transporter ATP-binding protein EcfA2
MIEKLKLTNFQAHRKLEIEFDPKITTIMGRTDSGKSSIIRALLWIIQNKPVGHAFVRRGKKKTTVRLVVDGKELVRQKGSDINIYKWCGEQYKSFGNGVPDDIALFLNLSNLNFQRQHDAPFWFSETAGQVSRNLNEIVDLDVIDRSLSKSASHLRTTVATLRVNKERLEGAREKKKQLAYVPEMVEEWAAVVGLEKSRADKAAGVAPVGLLVGQVRAYQGKAQRARAQALAALSLVELAGAARGLGARAQKLRRLLESITETRVRAAKLQGVDFSKLDLLFGDHGNACRSVIPLRAICHDIKLNTMKVEQCRKEVAGLEIKLGKSRCPLCGRIGIG